jgi:hypothetical protein
VRFMPRDVIGLARDVRIPVFAQVSKGRVRSWAIFASKLIGSNWPRLCKNVRRHSSLRGAGRDRFTFFAFDSLRISAGSFLAAAGIVTFCRS